MVLKSSTHFSAGIVSPKKLIEMIMIYLLWIPMLCSYLHKMMLSSSIHALFAYDDHLWVDVVNVIQSRVYLMSKMQCH